MKNFSFYCITHLASKTQLAACLQMIGPDDHTNGETRAMLTGMMQPEMHQEQPIDFAGLMNLAFEEAFEHQTVCSPVLAP